MAKFKVGDKCIVTKNLLSPSCVGDKVEIISIETTYDGRNFYHILLEGGIKGIASEKCLELIKEEENA